MSRALAFAFALAACNAPRAAAPDLLAPSEFASPQPVTITGWTGSAMEPCLSRDGTYLVFNNSNDPAVNTDLHYAERVDDLTFTYRGPLAGTNTPALDAVAALADDATLYFISTRSYDTTRATIYRGHFAAGVVSDIALVDGLATAVAGRLVFDVTVSADGQTLAFAEGVFTGASLPTSATLLLAERSGAGFARSPTSTTTLATINALGGLVYAPVFSASMRELYFTRTTGSAAPQIWVARRTATSEPFGAPSVVTAAEGFVEAPTLSPDETSLYYHRQEGALYAIYRVTRPSPP